jgi:PAS domain S-box-containing protein
MDKPRVLVAEDEGIIAKDLENILKGLGYGFVGSVSSGKEAIRKAEETRPDLILMDIVLRGKSDGVEAAQEIRSRLDIPVVFLTAFSDERTLRRAKLSGPFGYLLKPIEEKGLRGAIEVALQVHAVEKRLKKLARDWQTTFDSIQDWVSIHDPHFRIVRTNRAMAEAVQSDPEGLVGKACYQVFHGSHEPIPQCPHRQTMETRRPVREEIFEPRMGIHLEISTSPVFDEKGELTGTVHIAKDISERKRAEETIRRSEQAARKAAEENAAMAEIGRIVSSSPRIEEVYDRLAEMIWLLLSFDRIALNFISDDQKSFSVPYVSGPDIDGRRSGEEVPLAGTAMEEVIRTRSSFLLGKKDRKEVLERYPGLGPVFDAGFQSMILAPMVCRGQIIGVLNLQSFQKGLYGEREVKVAESVADQIAGAVANARLHKKTVEGQEALRKSEERYRRLFEGIPIGLYRSTPGGELIDANPAMARLLGYPGVESLLRKDMSDTYLDAGEWERFKTRMEKKGRVDQFRVQRLRKDGTHIWIETNSVVVRGPDGAIECYEGSAQDITEQMAYEEELALKEDLARQLALQKTTLAEIGRIISSTPTIEEVYESFAGEVKKLLLFDLLVIALLDREKETMVNRFVHGKSVPGREVGKAFPLRGTFGEAVIASRRGIFLQVESVEETIARYPGLEFNVRAGLKSAISVPLFSRDEPIGVLYIMSHTVRPYREEELSIARNIADQIAGAVANTLLFQERKRAEESLRRSEEEARRLAQENFVMAEIGRIISSSLDIETVYDRFGQEVYRLFSCDQMYVNLVDYERESFYIPYIFGPEIAERRRGNLYPLAGTATEEIIRTRSSLLVRKEEEVKDRLPGLRPLFEAGFKSLMMVPLIDHDKVIGNLSIQSTRPNAYGARELKLAERVGNQIAGAIASSLLFKEQKTLQSQLAQAQKLEAVGQLAAGIAHEINTPAQYVGDNTRFLDESFRGLKEVLEKYGRLLAAVKSGEDGVQAAREVEEAIGKADLPYLTEEIPRAISQSLEGVERVTQIVRAMKEFSHPGVKEKVMADINKAVENTVTISRNEWKYVADLSLDLDPSVPLIPCYPGEFNQVILNIIVNAAHAIADVVGDGSGGKGTIRVSTRLDREWVEVRISDTGGGIPESARPRVFDPFFTTKAVGKGTGQGLAIAHSVIVKKHGGTIHFETEMGKGTTFIIRLPVAPKKEDRGSKEEKAGDSIGEVGG